MTQYNTLSIKFSKSQLNKLKSGLKNDAEVTLKIPWNVFGDSNDKNNFKHNLLLRNTQVSKLRKAFANNSLANIKSSKTQLHKIKQSGGFSGGRLGPLLKDLTRRTAFDKTLRDKAFSIAKIPKYDGYQRGLPSMVCKFFDQKTSSICIKNQKIFKRIKKVLQLLMLFKILSWIKPLRS